MSRPKALLLFYSVVFLISVDVVSQDNIIYRYHYLHQGLLNPAVTGSEYFPQASLTYQKQWVGIPQSPQTMLASASMRIGNFGYYNPKKLINTSNLKSRERIGLGLSIFSDRNGPSIERGINFAYAYHLVVGRGRFSLGLAGSAEQKMLDQTIFRPTSSNDPILNNTRESFMLYNANVGAYYYSSGLFGGLAIHHLIPLENKLQPSNSVKPDFIIHGGYLFSSLGTPRLEISANIRVMDYNQYEGDINVRAYIQHYHWLAVSVRSYKALAVHVGFKISAMHLAYTYEANLTNMVHYSLGTHALHLGMNMGMRRTKGF